MLPEGNAALFYARAGRTLARVSGSLSPGPDRCKRRDTLFPSCLTAAEPAVFFIDPVFFSLVK